MKLFIDDDERGNHWCCRGGNAVELPGVAGTAVFKVFDLEVARTGLTIKEALNFGKNQATIQRNSHCRNH